MIHDMGQTNQSHRNAHERMVGGHEDQAVHSGLTPVVKRMGHIQDQLSCTESLICMLYDRLSPITVFNPATVEKENAKDGAMCDLESALHCRELQLVDINRKLDRLLSAIQI